MTPLEPNEFRCYVCEQVFQKARSDEEAHKEMMQRYRGLITEKDIASGDEPIEVLCDDCHKKFLEFQRNGANA